MVGIEVVALGLVFGAGVYGGHRGRVERGTFRGSAVYGQAAALLATAAVVVVGAAAWFVLSLLSGSLGAFVGAVAALVSFNGVVGVVVTAGLVALLGTLSGIVGNLVFRS